MRTILLFIATLFTSICYTQTKPTYQIEVHRNGSEIGAIEVEMFPDLAPNHVNNFDSLVNINFYDSLAFHRVIEGFVIQGGDPNTLNGPDSTWGPGQDDQTTVDAEFNPVSYVRGVFGAARSNDPNSATSQYFICHNDATFLDENYTAYGRVISGIEIVDSVALYPTDVDDRPIDKTIMFITKGNDVNSTLQPTILASANALDNINYIWRFHWEPNLDALYYEIEISQDQDFTLIENSRTTNDTTMLLTNIETNDITYYWRVKAYDGATTTTSETRTFLTGDLVSVEDSNTKDLNDYYYNFINKSLEIRILHTSNRIEVYALNGQLVKQISNSNGSISLNDIPAGTFIVRIIEENQIRVFKVVN